MTTISLGSKVAILRSLNRVLDSILENLRFRETYKPAPGSVEMGHLLGLQDGARDVEREIKRVTRMTTKRKK